MSTILDGKGLADIICDNLKWFIKLHDMHDVSLTIITTSPDKANQLYLKNKIKRCKEIGIHHTVIEQNALNMETLDFVRNRKVPVIIQAPFNNPDGHDLDSYIEPAFDVDGFVSKDNLADLYSGSYHVRNEPCTPLGIMTLLSANKIPVCGKHICILGRSIEVGKPLAAMMSRENATVSVCHRYTPGRMLENLINDSDILVSAIGSPNVIENIPIDLDRLTSKVLVDVGINHVNIDGHPGFNTLVGDIPQKIKDQSLAYTPVPGGVGPMTVAMLMFNVVKTYSVVDMYPGDFCVQNHFRIKYQESNTHNWLMN